MNLLRSFSSTTRLLTSGKTTLLYSGISWMRDRYVELSKNKDRKAAEGEVGLWVMMT